MKPPEKATTPPPRPPGSAPVLAVLALALSTTLATAYWIDRNQAHAPAKPLNGHFLDANNPSNIVLISGTLVSVLLCGLIRVQGRARAVAENARLEISRVNETLEQRILERTRELTEANRQLTRFKTVADNTSDLVAMTDMDGTTVYTNLAGFNMLGYAPENDVRAFKVKDVYPDHVYQLFEREGFPHALAHGHWSAQLVMKHRLGHEIPVSFVGIIVRAPDGTPEYMACIARDVSAQHQLEKQLRESLEQERELHQLKSSFVNIISHEFRTPLGIILFASSMIRRYETRFGPQQRAGQLDVIDESVLRMNDLVEQSLSLGRAEAAAPRKELLDLRALCQRLIKEVLSATSHRSPISFDCHEDLAQAFSDQTMLRSILVNLLGNAVKYSPAASPVILHLRSEGQLAVFTVRDHGPGLSDADIPNLFTTFQRGSDTAGIPGTGLGLAIVKRCAEGLDGNVLARNAGEGGGAEFVVSLPLFPTL